MSTNWADNINNTKTKSHIPWTLKARNTFFMALHNQTGYIYTVSVLPGSLAYCVNVKYSIAYLAADERVAYSSLDSLYIETSPRRTEPVLDVDTSDHTQSGQNPIQSD